MKTLHTRTIAVLAGGALATSMLLTSAPARADKSKAYKTGAIILGAAAVYSAINGKDLPAAIAGAGAYYAYKKSKDAKNQRYSDNGYYGNGNYNSYPADNGGYTSYPADNGYYGSYPADNGGYNNGGYASYPTDNGNYGSYPDSGTPYYGTAGNGEYSGGGYGTTGGGSCTNDQSYGGSRTHHRDHHVYNSNYSQGYYRSVK